MKYKITDMTIRIEGKRREPGEIVELSEADGVRLARYLIAVPSETLETTPQDELPILTEGTTSEGPKSKNKKQSNKE